MDAKKRGGKREGAGRKATGRQEYKSFRVKIEYAPLIKLILEQVKRRPELQVAINRTIYSDSGKAWSSEALLLERVAETERDAAAAITRLESQVAELRDNSESAQLRAQLNNLTKELYPALARLRELEPEKGW